MIRQEWSLDQHQYFLIHYKNCIFQGQIKNKRKQNTGIIILDNGQVLIGNFTSDQLEGDCIVFLNCETYVIGSFSRGMLDGTFVLRNPKFTIYWTAKMNKIQGQIILINYEDMLARNWIIQNGQGLCMNQISLIEVDKQNQILSKLSPSLEPYSLSVQFLYERFSHSLKIQSSSLAHTSQISLPTNSSYKLKLTLFKDKLIQYGVYHLNELNGLGYAVEGTDILQGRFKNGKLDGYGLKMDLQMEKIIYGTFHNGDIRSIDVISDKQETARKQFKNYKKQQHIFSLQYENNYFNQRPILMLRNFLKMMEENDQNFSRQLEYQEQIQLKREQSFDKQSNNILASAKLNLTANRKDRGATREQGTQSSTKTQPFQSRFKKNTNFIDSANIPTQQKTKSQFSDGISELTRINKALRKFK